ncbi:MAG TPA: primase C-terminal domain-containing protein, partial [Dermatophilaceae bacterium]|nr:primase C-terminal domain-containing protein [Dermatophilaceae bacterium]
RLGVSRRSGGGYRRSGGWGIEPLARTVREAEVGERNSILYWAACRAAEYGLDPEPLFDAALEVGLEPDKVERTIASAAKKIEETG